MKEKKGNRKEKETIKETKKEKKEVIFFLLFGTERNKKRKFKEKLQKIKLASNLLCSPD